MNVDEMLFFHLLAGAVLAEKEKNKHSRGGAGQT